MEGKESLCTGYISLRGVKHVDNFLNCIQTLFLVWNKHYFQDLCSAPEDDGALPHDYRHYIVFMRNTSFWAMFPKLDSSTAQAKPFWSRASHIWKLSQTHWTIGCDWAAVLHKMWQDFWAPEALCLSTWGSRKVIKWRRDFFPVWRKENEHIFLSYSYSPSHCFEIFSFSLLWKIEDGLSRTELLNDLRIHCGEMFRDIKRYRVFPSKVYNWRRLEPHWTVERS